MNTEINVQKMKQEVISAICYFENVPYLERTDIKIQDDFNQFFTSIVNNENCDVFIKIEEKYGLILKHYRDQKNNFNIQVMKDISKFFLIITILSIVIVIIASIVFATS